MKRHIRLADVTVPTPPNTQYSAELLAEARAALAARGLRFDNATGIIRDDSGELERFVQASDHVPAESEEEVMRWQFSRHINNEAHRRTHQLHT